MRSLPSLAALSLLTLAPSVAHASCFCMLRPLVADSAVTDDPSYNPATAVFLLRDGTHTVMTIEAAYEGPTTELSLVVPVPEPVRRTDVRTISGSHFRRIDRATAPKVHHVWPGCSRRWRRRATGRALGGAMGGVGEAVPDDGYGIEVEDEWEVDEYDVSVLNASQSTGLLRYLRERGLALPDRARTALRAYIETGHRFVFLRADPSRARRVGGRMVLSPIQLAFDSEELRVPVRLGTLNSPGEQELLLYVLSPDGRFELANRANVHAPTEVRLGERPEGGLGRFYAALMDRLFERHPNAAVTEAAVAVGTRVAIRHVWFFGLDRYRRGDDWGRWRERGRWTLTRIRHRYGADLDDDLVLRPAAPLRAESRSGHWLERRPWARRGANDYSVRFLVRHEAGCDGGSRDWAREWATADATWASGQRPWPGHALLDDVPTLGIVAGSDPPTGWTDEPADDAGAGASDAAPASNGAARHPDPSRADPSRADPSRADPSRADPSHAPSGARPAPAEDGGLPGCGVAPGTAPFPLLALTPALALALRRRSRAR
ncbi:MAG TPA: DUF2330 domain-containing protein [Sandaracinaceae bacterium LLY-WYZ-13_1]|nr:DUF2330 domain-containing protein [Sandaracinaceae bacterium LLY-WYZ-13_1]